ncbi:cyclase family protein [Sorangium sp. So ce1014]|uniref:cyclase family protein n=1 Tax=Sorangium sp. So ce1014 TaxID=3133326 RepID=UPI003F5E7D2C
MQQPALNRSEEPWLDVSVPIRNGMVHWPDNPDVEIVQTHHLERGDPATVSRLSLGVHTGTHVDAPAHFIRRGAGVDRIPLDRLIGPARVLDLGEADRIRPAHLARVELHPGDRVLFKTRNSRTWDDPRFRSDYTYLSLDAARHLVERGVWTVGIDYLSIGGMDDGAETHQILLAAGVCVIEGLDLSRVEHGWYDFVGLPIRLEDLDGAPARVVLRRRRS